MATGGWATRSAVDFHAFVCVFNLFIIHRVLSETFVSIRKSKNFEETMHSLLPKTIVKRAELNM